MSDFRDMMTNMKLKWVEEEGLPEIPKEIYDAMFRASILNASRYFPYMEGIDGTKFYLINLKEE